MLILASSANLSSITHLPWWAQFSIGIGLIVLAAALGWVDDMIDSDFLGVAAYVSGLAGAVVTVNVLLS